jgi:hypothetical protein
MMPACVRRIKVTSQEEGQVAVRVVRRRVCAGPAQGLRRGSGGKKREKVGEKRGKRRASGSFGQNGVERRSDWEGAGMSQRSASLISSGGRGKNDREKLKKMERGGNLQFSWQRRF